MEKPGEMKRRKDRSRIGTSPFCFENRVENKVFDMAKTLDSWNFIVEHSLRYCLGMRKKVF